MIVAIASLSVRTVYREQDWMSPYTLFVKDAFTNPNNARLHFNAGLLHRTSGHTYEALSEFHKAITIKPDDGRTYNQIGAIFMNMGHYAEAETSFRACIKYSPNFGDGHANLGSVILQQVRAAGDAVKFSDYSKARRKEAVEYYMIALKYSPGIIDIYINLGAILMDDLHVAEAREIYRQGLVLDPRNPMLLSNMGLLLQNKNELDMAEQYYLSAIAEDKMFFDAPRNLAAMLSQDSLRLMDSIPYFLDAIAINPNHLGVQLQYANTLARIGTPEAIETALKIFPRVIAHASDGRVYVMLSAHAVTNATQGMCRSSTNTRRRWSCRSGSQRQGMCWLI